MPEKYYKITFMRDNAEVKRFDIPSDHFNKKDGKIKNTKQLTFVDFDKYTYYISDILVVDDDHKKYFVKLSRNCPVQNSGLFFNPGDLCFGG